MSIYDLEYHYVHLEYLYILTHDFPRIEDDLILKYQRQWSAIGYWRLPQYMKEVSLFQSECKYL
jgi:hypothetical protein